MEQNYSKIISSKAMQLGLPNAIASITIPAGDQLCTAIDYPGMGRIVAVTIKQANTDGTQVAFTADLLASGKLFSTNTAVATGTAPADDLSIYRIVPQLSASAGDAAVLDAGVTGYSYRNLDGGFTVRQNLIYLNITPTGAGTATNWTAIITMSQENG